MSVLLIRVVWGMDGSDEWRGNPRSMGIALTTERAGNDRERRLVGLFSYVVSPFDGPAMERRSG